MPMRALPLLIAFAAAALSGQARAEDDPACAKYQDPLAYNACLASHGPKATGVGENAGSAGGGDAPQAVSAPPHPAAPTRARVWRRAPRGHGRAHMEFRVK